MSQNNEMHDELDLDDYREREAGSVFLQTHQRINQDLCGEIVKLEQGYVKVSLRTTNNMVADDVGLVHGGFIFSAADYAAMAAVNEKNVVLVGSDVQFLSPVKVHDIVDIVARVRQKEGRKRNVHVEAFVLDIKVFEGEFKTVITERHVLKLNLLDTKESQED